MYLSEKEKKKTFLDFCVTLHGLALCIIVCCRWAVSKDKTQEEQMWLTMELKKRSDDVRTAIRTRM